MAIKSYFELLRLEQISKRAKGRWTLALLMVLVLLVANVVSGYFFVASPPAPPEVSIKLTGVVLVGAGDRVGTGFFVAPDYVLTAAHVAQEVGTTVEIRFESGESVQGRVVASGYNEWKRYLVGESEVSEGATPYDWAAIRVDQPVGDVTPLACGSSTNAGQAQKVFMAGHPGGQALTISQGVISRIEQDRVLTDGPIDPGFSGGPMIVVEEGQPLESGLVVGIIVSAPQNLRTVNCAIAIDVVRNNCGSLGISF